MLIKKILIGIDNSKFAEHAAEYGFDIAHKFKAKVGLVHIVEPVVTPYINSGDPMLGSSDIGVTNIDLINIQDKAGKSMINDAIKKFGDDLDITQYEEFGDTADGIINCSKEFGADLIVIGTHSRTGIDRLLMGSIAEHVVRHSEVPVLVVPFHESDSE
ncbi:universal stress protein [Mucilaginibacter sp. UR6-11]|uniref:universal stress protein n=1 Tax=Mucilaginibacter sp. UR6-11 TaxID=1435644 RepID=UPI001E5AF706|nr:universal stress protein [Mucilaginibacter sp. UR6-11]MCC8425099.1 universal stress protein [Mucilaginibacter sp. UR6-11]